MALDGHTKTVGDLEEALANSTRWQREFAVVFVNSDSGHRTIGQIEVDPAHKTVWLYERLGHRRRSNVAEGVFMGENGWEVPE